MQMYTQGTLSGKGVYLRSPSSHDLFSFPNMGQGLSFRPEMWGTLVPPQHTGRRIVYVDAPASAVGVADVLAFTHPIRPHCRSDMFSALV